MYARLTKVVRKMASWNILYDLQYGFRSKKSNQHAILEIVNTYSKIWTMGKSCDAFIDLSKEGFWHC